MWASSNQQKALRAKTDFSEKEVSIALGHRNLSLHIKNLAVSTITSTNSLKIKLSINTHIQVVPAFQKFALCHFAFIYETSLVAQLVENPPATRETWVPSLAWEDPLEKETATPSSTWPGEFHGLYSPWGCKEPDTTERLSLHFILTPVFIS